MGFYGHWKNAGSYLTCSAQLGWLCLGCDLTAAPDAACEEVQAAADSGADGGELTVVPRDAFGRRLYLQPLGLLLEVQQAWLYSKWCSPAYSRSGLLLVAANG